MIFQILIVLFSIFAIASLFSRAQKSKMSFRSTAFWIFFWIVGDIAVLWPNSTTILANILGIGRGTDLVLYVSVVVLFFLLFRLHIKIESISRDVTKVVRKNAIDEKIK
jgi:hypothetical protein